MSRSHSWRLWQLSRMPVRPQCCGPPVADNSFVFCCDVFSSVFAVI